MMKNIKSLVLALTVVATTLVSCKNEVETTKVETNSNQEVTKSSQSVAKAETATMKIGGMTCAMGCAKTIENKLSGLDGVQKATVDFEKELATIQYDAAVQNPEALAKFIEGVADGKTYKVSDIKKI